MQVSTASFQPLYEGAKNSSHPISVIIQIIE